MPENKSREWLTALQDDALDRWPEGEVFDEAALAQWRRHTQASAALRGEVVANPDSTQRLLNAVHAAQAADGGQPPAPLSQPSVLRPSASDRRTPHQDQPTAALGRQQAANEARYVWPWAAAVMLAFGVWTWWPSSSAVQSTVVAQQAAPAALTADASPNPAGALLASEGVLRDPQLDALLQSHRQWGGGAGLVFPAAYVRNVALER